LHHSSATIQFYLKTIRGQPNEIALECGVLYRDVARFQTRAAQNPLILQSDLKRRPEALRLPTPASLTNEAPRHSFGTSLIRSASTLSHSAQVLRSALARPEDFNSLRRREEKAIRRGHSDDFVICTEELALRGILSAAILIFGWSAFSQATISFLACWRGR
jgi:hypothetical protein